MRFKRPFSRKSTLQRVLDTIGDQFEAAGAVKPDLPDVSSHKTVRTGLIAAGSVAGLTAASAGISSLRRRLEGPQGDA